MKVIKYILRWLDYFLYRIDQKVFYKYSLKKYGNSLGIRLNKNYTKHAKDCNKIYNSTNQLNYNRNTTLRTEGTLLIKNVLPKEITESVVKLFDANIKENKDVIYHHDISVKLRSAHLLKKSIFETIFNNQQVNQALIDYFGSYYQIIWADTYRSLPAEAKSSWLWHIDNCPCEVIKIMVLYTNAGIVNGGTCFLSHNETKTFIENGYFGENIRFEDLSPFAQQHNISYKPVCYEASAGDILIFNNNLLHRGLPPQKGNFRDVSTMLLTPSKKPWYETFNINNINPPFEKASYYLNPASNTGNPLYVSYFNDYLKKEIKWLWTKLTPVSV